MKADSPLPPFYSEEELDTMYQRDPLEAMRISRRQTMLEKALEAQVATDANAPPPSESQVLDVLKKVRHVLMQDGGDLELVEIRGMVVRVRMKGNCAGCPRSALDLKQVVEKTLKQHFPQIEKVENAF